MSRLRILFLGDIVGKTGCAMFQKHIGRLKRELSLDAIVVNGENSCQGRGITSKTMQFFKHNGVDVVTSGNHVWHNKEILTYLDQQQDLLRPANYPGGCPGVGVTTFACQGYQIGIMNLQGRTFMRDQVECPFKSAESILTYLQHKADCIFVDFHAEASSEKMGLAYFLDGKITGLVGTHTHVQTADERILPGGTAYITDLGMAGSWNSMIGMIKEPIIQHFITQMPVRFTVDTSIPLVMTGVVIEADPTTGKAIDIQRVKVVDDNIVVDGQEA